MQNVRILIAGGTFALFLVVCLAAAFVDQKLIPFAQSLIPVMLAVIAYVSVKDIKERSQTNDPKDQKTDA